MASSSVNVGRTFEKTGAGRVFPCHLAPIDRFFVVDDSPAYPMTSVIHLDFSGPMERSSFDWALEQGLRRHPLFTATLSPAKQGKVCWVSGEGDVPKVDFGPRTAPIEIPPSGFDLRREPGLRIWVRVDEDSTRLTLEVHHACSDGTGVYRFLGDVLALYAEAVSRHSRPAELSPLDPTQLKSRRRKMAGRLLEQTTWQSIRAALSEGYRILGPPIAPLTVPNVPLDHLSDEIDPPGICTRELDADEHQLLRKRAANSGAMLNDLLLSEMFGTIVEWNRRYGRLRDKDRLRIMMPFDLRGQEDFSLPAANMTAYTFVTRQAKVCLDREGCLQGVLRETSQIKSGHSGTAFIEALMMAEHVPYLLPFLLRRERCFSTVTLSNVGDPTKRFTSHLPRSQGRIVAGNLVLERVIGVPPLRRQMHASLAIFSYLRKLTICVRCDRSKFSDGATQAFLDTYVNRLRENLARAEGVNTDRVLRRSA